MSEPNEPAFPFPDKKYSIIYADPPWEYRKSGGIASARGLAKSHYPTMPLSEILSLPVAELAGKDCYLFLWTTGPRIGESLAVLKAWGFDFFTIAFVWVKTYEKSGKLFWGMGNATRANAEFCLLSRRGKLPRASRSVHSVVMSPIGIHSQKPSEVRARIVELYGDVPRIELFAREKVDGWDAWGNDACLAEEARTRKEG